VNPAAIGLIATDLLVITSDRWLRDAAAIAFPSGTAESESAAAALPSSQAAAASVSETDVQGPGGAAGRVDTPESVDRTDTRDTLVIEFGKASLELPTPGHAELLTNFLPLDRASLENAIDQFLDRFESLGASLPDLQQGTSLVPAIAAAAITALATNAILSRRRGKDEKKDEAEEDGEAVLGRFSSLSDLWYPVLR
jgi:hypothetical protein